jgi:uncharacterized protein (DUF885 family)
MKFRSFIVLFFIICCSLGAQNPNTNSTLLKKIHDDFWQNELKENIYLRLKYGLPVESLPDLTYEKAKKDTEFVRDIRDRLNGVKPEELSHEELLTLRSMEWELDQRSKALPFFYLNFLITPYSSPLPTIQRVFTEFQFKTAADQQRYLKLSKDFAVLIKSCERIMREQWTLGIGISKDELAIALPYVQSLNKPVPDSFLNVNSERMSSIQGGDPEFQKVLALIVEKEVNPAIQNLTKFLTGDYSKYAPQGVGLAQYPLGRDYYRFLVGYHTTMDVTPEEVQNIGLKKVEEIQAEMKKIRDQLGFTGTKEDFKAMLKKDPRFIPKTPDEIGERFRANLKKIEPKMKEFFLQMPKAPYGVKRLDPALEGSMTYGYYQEPTPSEPTGYYNYNGSNLPDRSLLNSAAIIYHEILPGHHYQIDLQNQNSSLPEFRRNFLPTAYVEGWAEYATDVADEMGMYADPYDRYGYLADMAFLYSRLVVDPGMNTLGWTREKAMQYMRDNTLLSEKEIQTETLRYCCDIPGQALGYRMGAQKIHELRDLTQKALGEKFDIRKFHNAVLSSGALPMSVLEEHIQWFIENQK